MGVFRYLIFLKLLLYTDAIKSKSINLALETVLEFNNKDRDNDVKFLDNVQQFIDKIKSVMGTNKTARRFNTENTNMKFTDFLESAIDTLKTYDDDDLEDVFAVLDDEIRKYHYRGCKFYELVGDRKVRRFLANKLDDLKDKPARKLRKKLDYAIQAIEYSKPTEFFDYVNSIYGQDSRNKLIAFLNNLQTYSSKSKRANLDLNKLVRDGLRSLIFDHYSALNPNARRDLKIKLETSWSNFKYPERLEHRVWTVKYTYANRNKYSKIDARSNDIKEKLTTGNVNLKAQPQGTERNESSEMSDFEEKMQTSYHTHKPSHKKRKNVKNVYFFNKKIGLVINNKESTTSPVKLKMTNSEGSLSSELLQIKDESTSHYKSKRRPEKPTDSNEKIQRLSKAKKVTPKKFRHAYKKLSSFITLYPEGITFNNEKPLKIKSTQKPRLFTLWDEKIRHKDEKGLILRTSKSKTNINKHTVIAETGTVINVVKAVVSSEDGSSQNGHLKTNSETKSTKHHAWHETETTESKYKPTTHKKFRKHMPQATTLEEGISIESYEINRRSLREHNINDAPPQIKLKGNVLRRINNLEKQMEEVKSKIGTTKLTTKKNMLKATEFEVLEFWTGTTDFTTTYDIINNSVSVSSITKPATESIKGSVTQFETKNSTEMRSNSNKTINTESSNKMNNITNKEGMTTDSINLNLNASFYDDEKNDNVLINLEHPNNDIGIDMDKDIDKIMKKYNINAKPDKVKPFNVDEFMSESKKSYDKGKANEVKDIVENDMKRLLSGKSKDLGDPFQDLNASLDWMKH